MSDLFKSLPISEDQNNAMRHISNKCDELYDALMAYAEEDTRYAFFCKAKLEEFSLWANKLISREFK